MHQIKQLPEDFVVNEISSINTQDNGQYSYYILKKISYSTVDALETLSEKLNIPLKNIGFAGNKDKNAITEQKISIFRGNKKLENINIKNMELKYLGNGKIPISLGDLEGNEFTITVRNLDNEEIKKIKQLQNKKIDIPNLFGPQRFSKNNHLVGKAIIKRDFKKAVELMLENDGYEENKIRIFLKENSNNYIGALRIIPLKTRKLLVHAYQSHLFNETINNYLKIEKNNQENIKIPLIGFNFELETIKNKSLKDIIKKILSQENINSRDFIINQIPELTSEGGSRDLFFELKNLEILNIEDDDLNEGKKKIKIRFTLPKSCYATTLLGFIFSRTDDPDD